MENPLISIIVPIYNTEKYLKNCLDSILAQTYNNLEIILVDDGSTDNSGKIADDYAAKDQRIKVIHQKNAGQSNARNTGISLAKGDFLSFIDSDDEIRPTFIAKLLKKMDADTTLTVCGMHYKKLLLNIDKNVYIKHLRPQKSHETLENYVLFLLTIDDRMYSSVNKLYHAGIIKKHHLKFQEKLNFAEDTKFVLDYLKLQKGQIQFVNEPLYVYNFGTDTSTIKKSSTKWSNWQNSYQNLKTWTGPKLSASEKFWLFTVYLRWKISYLKSVL